MQMYGEYEIVLQFGCREVRGQRFADATAARHQVSIMRALYPEARVAFRPLPKRPETAMLSLSEIMFEDDPDTDSMSLDELKRVDPGTALLRLDELIFGSDTRPEVKLPDDDNHPPYY